MRDATPEQCRQLLEFIDQPIFALNLEGEYVILNAAAAAVRGRTRQDQLGSPYSRFVRNPEVADAMVARARAGEVVTEKIEVALPNGQAQVIVDRLGPWRDDDGQVVAIWGSAMDASVYETLGEVQQESQVLRELDEARKNLLSIVSHELRTPLASIQGYASTYLLYEDRLEPEERRDFVRRIVDSTLQLEELVDNLLTASRIEHGTLEMSLRPAQLSKIVFEAIAEAHQRWDSEQIEFTGPERCELVLDPRRIRQVIHNLLDNAKKYGGDGPIEVVLEDQEQKVWVTVRDHGPGFAEGYADRLFERFYRGRSEFTAKGTGLGLWITRAIVEAHGGRIVAASPGDGGALFTFSLPRGLQAPEA
ncbi:MAG: ATP-binding protein [Dehalococcoidia bacterium]